MKRFLYVLLALLLAFTLISCGSAAPDNAMEQHDSSSPQEAAGEAGVDDGYSSEEDYGAVQDQEMGPSSIVQDTDRMLVYTVDLAMNSYEYAIDYQKIKASAAKFGGFVQQEETTGTPPTEHNPNGRYTSMTLRIPTKSLDAFMDELSQVGTLLSKNIQSDDITTDYYDTQARVDMLESRYDKLNEHYKEAKKMEDIITLEQEMSDILYQLDKLKGSVRSMDQSVEYATVYLQLEELVRVADVPAKTDFSERLSDSYAGGWRAMEEFGQGLLVFFAGAFPVLLILIVLAAVALTVSLLVRRSKRKYKAAAEEQKREA
jgi:hypothetical protein